MIRKTANRDIVIASGDDVGARKSWMHVGVFQLDDDTGDLLQLTDAGFVYRSPEEQTVQLGNNLTGSATISKSGSIVTIVSDGATHSSASTPISNTGIIPDSLRPNNEIQNVFYMDSDELRVVRVAPSSGFISFRYLDWSGAAVNRESTGSFSVSYGV